MLHVIRVQHAQEHVLYIRFGVLFFLRSNYRDVASYVLFVSDEITLCKKYKLLTCKFFRNGKMFRTLSSTFSYGPKPPFF